MDLGIELAKRGWQVTGIDIVDKALRRARDRVQAAGVDMRLVRGDVTALGSAGVGSRLPLGARHGDSGDLNSDQRDAMGREVSAIAAPKQRAAARVAEAQEAADTGCEP